MSIHISNSLVIGQFPIEFPLSHARIGWRNIVRAASVTATPSSPATSSLALFNDFTYERYQPQSLPATIEVDNGTAVEVDYLGIASHDLGDTGTTIDFQYSFDASTWVTVDSFSVPDNSTIMRLTQRVSARYWRVRLTGGDGQPFIGIIYMGLALAMMRPIYGGHSPITLSRTTANRPQQTETGQFMGRNIARRGLQSNLDFTNLKPDWYRDNFDPFVVHAYERPFFVAWRPLSYPDEVAFCELPAGTTIQPTNTGRPDLMSVSVPLKGLAV